MYNSTISPKYGKCIDCNDGLDKPVIAGRCKGYHYPIYRKKIIYEKRKERNKVRSLHSLQDVDKKIENLIALYYKLAAVELAKNPYCQECGAFIPDTEYDPERNEWIPTQKFYRAATAHVLPKRKEYGFPSVASNPINRLFLGAGCGCHGRFDKSWEDAASMKVWKEAVAKFLILFPLIPDEEFKNIPELLLKELIA